MEQWFAELRDLPSALEATVGAQYALHGFLDGGRGVAVRVATLQRGAIVVRRARIVANGPWRISDSSPPPGAVAATATLPPLSVSSFAGCGPVFKPFDRGFNERGGQLVDYYSESARMRARRRDEPLPPVDAWREVRTCQC